MDTYVCLTLLSLPGESETGFKARLSAFWTHMLRNHPTDYEKVYAETTLFEPKGNRLMRGYLVEVDTAPILAAQLSELGVEHEPIDADDLYSKYEATSPDWFQIDH